MKFRNKIMALAMASILMSSCDDQIMDWYEDPSHGKLTTAELPLELTEKIGRYKALKEYTDFKLGAGIGLSMYMTDTTYRRIVNENFDEVTVGYEMKHGAMMKSNGTIDFTNVDAFLAKTKEAGLSVFGHTLVWHSNQNAAYLNGLIAPTVIPGAAGSNSVDLSGLKDGTFTGWGKWNAGAGISVVDGAGLSSSAKAVKLVSSATSSAAYSLQLITPEVPIVSGHKYEVSFYIKSEQEGQGRLSFAGLNNNYPWKDWYATGGSWTESFATTSQWKQVKIQLAASDFKAGEAFKINIDLGYLPNITYFIDVNSISVVDKDAAIAPTNLITNGDFESGNLTGWGGWGNSSTRAVSAQGEGHGGTGYCMVLMNPTAASNYSAQQVYTFASALVQGKEYTCTFMVKATSAAKLQLEIQGADYNADYYGGIDVGTTWTQVTKKITPTKADRTKFIFDFGETATTFSIDNIVLTTGTASTEPTIIEKTEAEKTQIITNAMTDWISKMLGKYKADIAAWDVVNEPMREDGTLRDGNVSEIADDEFYWPKYMGKDYAVTAFKLARQYGNATDKLFINDYNLEYSLPKCDGLIEYVKYIESKGATVDGIGTQMHLSITSDTVKIKEMFQKLAASGKLIKVSELDIKLGTSTPTAVQLASQAAMYKFVMDMYMKYIPAAQRYGATAWGISDNKKEHEYWIPNDGPNLWDANYQRKHAYKGFADGLAGKDVSKDFSGELIIKKK